MEDGLDCRSLIHAKGRCETLSATFTERALTGLSGGIAIAYSEQLAGQDTTMWVQDNVFVSFLPS